MEFYNTGRMILILCALTNFQLVADGLDSQDVVIDRQSRAVMSTPNVYMAEAAINVGDLEGEYVDINVLRSATSNSFTGIRLAVEYDGDLSVNLEEEYLYLKPGSTNYTSRLHFKKYYDYFYTEVNIINVTIVSCSGQDKCNIIEPSSTIVTVYPENNVSISFDSDVVYASESNYCNDPEECSYETIHLQLQSSRYIENGLEIPLKIESESNATYLVDYFFDSDPPVANLGDSSYHQVNVYINNDDLVEGYEYILLSFDEDKLPPRVVIGDRGSTQLMIIDGDHGQMTLNGANQSYSETVGTIDIVVEINFLPETDLPINVHSYSNGTTRKDFEPFDGIYHILADTYSTVIPVIIIDDDLAENQEVISITAEAMTDIGDHLFAYGTISIEDDETNDNPLVFHFDEASLVADESSGTLELFIRANIKNEAIVVLDYYPAKENGLMEYRDYTSYFNNTIRRNIFQFDKTTEKLITVDIIDDCEIEGTEQMLLNISHLTVGSADLTLGNLTITVEDNDVEGMLMCPGMTRRTVRSVAGQPTLELMDRSDGFGSTAITTGLLAGLVSSLLVVGMMTILFGVPKKGSS